MKDISQNIITAKKVLKDLENINSNPALHGHEKLYNKLIELDLCVQEMFSDLESK